MANKKSAEERRKKRLFSLDPKAVEALDALATGSGKPASRVIDGLILGPELSPDVDAWVTQEAKRAGISRGAMVERVLLRVIEAAESQGRRKR